MRVSADALASAYYGAATGAAAAGALSYGRMRSPFLSILVFYQRTIALISPQRDNLPQAKDAGGRAVRNQGFSTHDGDGGASTKIFGIALTAVFVSMLLLNALSY